jgi:hypothetical protein
MEKEQITAGNKLIAKFMGYAYYPSNHIPSSPRRGIFVPGWKTHEWASDVSKFNLGKMHYLCRSHNGLQYYENWNWLMKVVEKIEKLTGNFRLVNNIAIIDENDEKGTVRDFVHDRVVGNNKKEAAWLMCVAFISWYLEKQKT